MSQKPVETELSASDMSKKFKVASNLLSTLNFIGGKHVRQTPGAVTYPVVEPATGKLLTTLIDTQDANEKDVSVAVADATKAYKVWSNLSGLDRCRVMHATAQLIRKNLDELAWWETKDNGKPLYESKIDIAGCADVWEYFGAAAATMQGNYHDLYGSLKRQAFEKREPLGVCGGIGAWNYPFQTATWKIAPALACGNAFVYKPSPWTPVTATLLAQLITLAGAPHGTVNVVQGGASAGAALCLHPDIKKISFTGSVPTGGIIQQACAKNNIKPVTLELGGKSPLIICDDSDLDSAVSGAMMANFFSQGQVCSNATRVYVHERIFDDFTAKLVQRTKAMPIGNPYEEMTRVGAMITEEHMNKVLGYIQLAKKEGARILCGGERVHPSDAEFADGFYVSPCVITDCTDDMRFVREEIFGSVLALMPYKDEDEVIRRANDSEFGLAAGVFTNDLSRAHRIACRLDAGNVYVNTFNDVAPSVPFGGYKQSGYGRENGLAALNHYSHIKSVWINTSGEKLEAPF